MTLPKPYYQDDYCTIYHGDCREVAKNLAPCDLLLTDPPYGLGRDKRMHKVSGVHFKGSAAPCGVYDETDWDHTVPTGVLELLIYDAKHAIVWGGNYYPLTPSGSWLVWDKENGTNDFADCELAWTNLKQPIRMKRHLWNGMLRKGGEQRSHPTQKPVELMEWCIGFTPKAKTILDPFMGSGTTLVAAKNLGRKAIGIEIEEKYCEVAARRLSQEVLPFGPDNPADQDKVQAAS